MEAYSLLERRKSERYHPKYTTFALIRNDRNTLGPLEGMSMGEIGVSVMKSNPCLIGEIENISMDGIGFHHIGDKIMANHHLSVEILTVDCRFYMKELPFTTISDAEIPYDPFNDSFKMRRVGLKWSRLKASQRDRLKEFVRNNTNGVA